MDTKFSFKANEKHTQSVKKIRINRKAVFVIIGTVAIVALVFFFIHYRNKIHAQEAFAQTQEMQAAADIAQQNEAQRRSDSIGIYNAILANINARKKAVQDSIEAARRDTLLTADLTLVDGGCTHDGCVYKFKNESGEFLISSNLPPNTIELMEEENGFTKVQPLYLNKKYKVAYKMQIIHYATTNKDFDEMVISTMNPIEE